MFIFDQDTALTATSDGTFEGEMTARWNIGTVPNGGYVLAFVHRAFDQLLPHPELLTISGHYVMPTRPGPTELHGETIREGRSTSVGMIRLVQDGQERARFMATAGHFDDEKAGVEDRHVTGVPSELPPRNACFFRPFDASVMPAFAEHVEIWHAPKPSRWMRGQGAGELMSGGHIRFADGRPPDVPSLGLFADAFMPTVFGVLGGFAWVPTLQLNVQFRARPSEGFLRVLFRTRHLTGGLHEEDGELWDESGKLVALSRQLARVRAPT